MSFECLSLISHHIGTFLFDLCSNLSHKNPASSFSNVISIIPDDSNILHFSGLIPSHRFNSTLNLTGY
jgi:hypothetical protein